MRSNIMPTSVLERFVIVTIGGLGHKGQAEVILLRFAIEQHNGTSNLSSGLLSEVGKVLSDLR
jgi:hypothetical protein